MQTKQLPENYDYLSPDNSEIRILLEMKGGGLCHCTLPPEWVSIAIRHKSVDEIWYFLEGEGQVWCKHNDQEKVMNVNNGLCLSIPSGTHFQFRNTGKDPLEFIIPTMPPWLGKQEAVKVKGYW